MRIRTTNNRRRRALWLSRRGTRQIAIWSPGYFTRDLPKVIYPVDPALSQLSYEKRVQGGWPFVGYKDSL